jgi:ribosome-binding ATPase YchF (GTP1/OBG family)
MRAKKGFKESDLAEIPLLTKKPVVYMFNVDEKSLHDEAKQSELLRIAASITPDAPAIFVNARIESELADLDQEMKTEFLAEYNLQHSGVEKLFQAAYDALGLQSFLTAGKKEVRAWTIKKGATAPQAAGAIHTDFERGFIAASVAKYDDLVELGSEKAVKEAGKLATCGRDYIMQDGDVVEFKFNV